MNKQLDEALCKDFPLLFADRHGDLRKTAMVWGFPGDGWEPIIRQLAEQIEPIIEDWWLNHGEDDPMWESPPRATQVKEKFGQLRFYMGAVPSDIFDEVHEWIDKASARSGYTCEVCGDFGVLRSGGWIRTLCDEHAEGREPTSGMPTLIHRATNDPSLWPTIERILENQRYMMQAKSRYFNRLKDLGDAVADLIYDNPRDRRYGEALLEDFNEWKEDHE